MADKINAGTNETLSICGYIDFMTIKTCSSHQAQIVK